MENLNQEQWNNPKPVRQNNKKLPAGLLAILLGSLGIHKFLLGYTTEGIIWLVISICTCGTVTTLLGFIEGIITDGDIRRMMENHSSIDGLTAEDIMARSPKFIDKDELAVHALEILKSNNISQLLVSTDNKYSGFVHIHDLLKEGII